MELKNAVEKYLEFTGNFGRPMPLGRFGVSKQEMEATLSAWDEDYHLNRHFELISSPAPARRGAGDSVAYLINGLVYNAIVFKETIRDVLA